MRWEDRAATPERILALVPAGKRRQALEIALEAPDLAAWKAFLEVVLTGLGTLVTASGVIYFIAYNWSSLGRFTKFALVELAILGAFFVGGRWGLTLAALLIGPLLALYGQTYQLHADSWRLFAGWAALMLPWTLAANHRPLWLAFWAVANTGLFQFFEEPLLIGCVNLLWWVVAELRQWEAGRWTVYASALMAMACWTFPACGHLLDPELSGEAVAVAVAVAGIFRVYRRRDGFMLALGCGSLIACVTSLLSGVLINHGDALGFLAVAALLVGQVSVATWWLRKQVAA